MKHKMDNTCPWCREELKNPKKFSGTCEHCGLPYHSVVYQRAGKRQDEESPYWIESSLLGWKLAHATAILVVLVVLFRGIDVYMRHRDFLLRAVLLLLAYISGLVLTPDSYRVKDREKAKDSGKTGKNQDRNVFLSSQYASNLLHGTYRMTVKDPATGAWQEPCEVRLNTEKNTGIPTLEVTDHTPVVLKQEGVEFLLEDDSGEPMVTGLVCGVFEEVEDTFLIVFDRSDEAEPLDITRHYVAYMRVDGEEVPFYMVLEGRDVITSAYNRRMTYIARLFCYDRKANTLPIPTCFSLQTPEGEAVTTGTVTEYFRTQALIKKIAKEAKRPENMNWY